TTSPTIANTAYGTPPVLTLVTPLNATISAARMPSGWMISQGGPTSDCLYLIFRSRSAMSRATFRLLQISEMGTRRLTGTIVRTGSSSARAAGLTIVEVTTNTKLEGARG